MRPATHSVAITMPNPQAHARALVLLAAFCVLLFLAFPASATTPTCPGCPVSTGEGPPQPACILEVTGCAASVQRVLQTLSGTTSGNWKPETLSDARSQIADALAKPHSAADAATLSSLQAWIDRIEKPAP